MHGYGCDAWTNTVHIHNKRCMLKHALHKISIYNTPLKPHKEPTKLPPSEYPMASLPTDLHFVLFPLMAQGHMIPMVDIARLLAEHGSTVTIVTTPVNANRFKPVIARAVKDKLKIQFLELQFPSTEVGLPEGCENFDLIPSAQLFPKLFIAANMLEEPAENKLRGLTPAPSCIISDNLFPWTNEIARKLNIPRLVFHGPGCFTFLCIHIAMNTNVLDEIVSDSEYFVLPSLPDRVELTKVQASSWGRKDKETAAYFETIRKAEEAANGIVVNSFQELEPYYAEELAKVKDKKVWCIGPVSLCNKNLLDIAERGSKGAISEHDCLKWLDSREPESVIFVCLGSLARLSTEQNIELGLGLESSKKPFLWCIRHATEELERWLIEEEYEERVKDRGLIIRGWAPQVLILSHRAVGGFVTHCGWNSTLEGISAGVPMVTWPHFADQFINERFIVDVLKTGVKIGAEVPVMVGEQDKFGVVVNKEDIKRSVEDLLDKGEEGEARRKRSRELGETAKRAMEDGGSSHLNMRSMIQDVVEMLGKNITPPIQDSIVQES
ncbi:putative UDP-glucuronosyl/UDP-glucosyltransferase, UDP-glycosyltransferase family [Helianthus annuus]|nr:putative UDP-glucuronosyl/UDP-glucosyltransferase, UDP-glycosyltransferase family [Helianthus annuus]